MLIHEELRKGREELGWTQAQLAARVGIPRNQIVRAERGDNITLDTLRKIAAHLPVENLTLLEKVKLNIDILPQPEKFYFGAMATVARICNALGPALDLAIDARMATTMARRAEPLPFSDVEEKDPEKDLFVLRSVASLFHELQNKLDEEAKKIA